MAEKKLLRVTTPPGRLSFPALFEAKVGTYGGAPKFSATILIPKVTQGKPVDISGIVAAVKAKLIEAFPDEASRPPLDKNRGPIKDGDTWADEYDKLKKSKYPEYAGCWVIKASSNNDNRPPIVDSGLLPITDPNQLHDGYWVRFGLSVFSYDREKKGVSFGLITVQKIKEDSRFGSSGNPEDFFDAMPNTDTPAPEAPAAAKGTDIFS